MASAHHKRHTAIRITKHFAMLAIMFLMASAPLHAQIERVVREKPYVAVPRSQTSRNPQAAAVTSLAIPAVAQPVDTIMHHGIPDARLGKPATKLFSEFPGIRIADNESECVVYETTDHMFFEVFDNRVVVARQTVKGNWKYPNEEWYTRIVAKAQASGITHQKHQNDTYTFFYPTFTFSIRYKKKTDTYVLRFEYLPSDMPTHQVEE